MQLNAQDGSNGFLKTTPSRSVLIVDDDARLRRLLIDFLQQENWRAYEAADGIEALTAIRTCHPTIILLDLTMPRLDGMEVCRRVRQVSQVPIIMLTARDDEVDKLLGLELGADDYLVKPFSMRELAARMKAILRRTQADPTTASPQSQAADAVLRCGGLVLDTHRHTAAIGKNELSLTPIEFSLLEVFLRHPGQVFNRLQLLEATHGFAFEGYERTIDAHIRNLRRKMEAAAPNVRYIRTVYGIGYKLGGEADV